VTEAPFVVDDAGTRAATVFSCGMCGTRFTHGGQVCSSCPLHAGCDLVKCPNCGFQFPRRSALVDWGARLWARLRGGRR